MQQEKRPQGRPTLLEKEKTVQLAINIKPTDIETLGGRDAVREFLRQCIKGAVMPGRRRR